MQSQPLDSSDQGKLLIFSIIMMPSIVFVFGMIPAIFLAFGIYMMKRNQDFSSIDTAVRNFKGYACLALVGWLLTSCYLGYKYFYEENGYYYDDPFLVSLMFSGIAFLYMVAVQILFYAPLNKHREWVTVNGIFSAKPRPV